jgi:hypothetical protein
VQTIAGAHATSIMKLAIWEFVLLSGSLDGSIKMWLPGEGGASVVRRGAARLPALPARRCSCARASLPV